MDLPSTVTENSFQNYLSKIHEVAKRNCIENMNEAGKRLHAMLDPKSETFTLNVPISVDGTWQNIKVTFVADSDVKYLNI